MNARENFIVINGAKYCTGTVFMINFNGKVQEAAFICYITKTNVVYCKLKDANWFISADDFRSRIIEITNKFDSSVHMPHVYKKPEMEVDGLFIGWLWYVFLMAISTIFKDVIGLWILISVAFFSWRKGKLKEEGTYCEW